MKSLLKQFERQREKRYKKTREVLKNITRILIEKYDVKKIILIGSCMKKDIFHSHSDIDICVVGLAEDLYFQAQGELLIEAGEFDVDIIPFEDISDRMRKNIGKGDVLYEKR